MQGIRYAMSTIAVTLAVTAHQAEAQFQLNVVAGPTIAHVSSPDFTSTSSAGFFFAGGTSLQINEIFSIDPYLVSVQTGGEPRVLSFRRIRDSDRAMNRLRKQVEGI